MGLVGVADLVNYIQDRDALLRVAKLGEWLTVAEGRAVTADLVAELARWVEARDEDDEAPDEDDEDDEPSASDAH